MSARSRSAPWFRGAFERYEEAIAEARPMVIGDDPTLFFFCVQCGFPAWLEDEEALDERPPEEHLVRLVADLRRENGVTRLNGIVLLNPLLCSMCLEKEAA